MTAFSKIAEQLAGSDDLC